MKIFRKRFQVPQHGRQSVRPRVEHLETRNLMTTVIKSAHLHLHLNFANGLWGPFQVEDTTHNVTYNPKDVLIFVDPAQKSTQPFGWNFIGAGDGNPFWHMDSSSSSPFVSLSVATEHIAGGTFDVYQPNDPRVTFAGEWITLALVKVEGPGEVSSWQNGQPPNAWWMSSFDDGATLPSVFYTEPGGHTHLNWGFTKTGVYKITLAASAYFGGEPEPVYSDEVTLKFGVETVRRPPNPIPTPPTVPHMNVVQTNDSIPITIDVSRPADTPASNDEPLGDSTNYFAHHRFQYDSANDVFSLELTFLP